MLEYISSLVVLSSALGLVLYASYPSAQTKSVRFAAAVILLSATVSPLVSLVSSLTPDDIESFLQGITSPDLPEGAGKFEEVAEEAFCAGVKKLIAEKYSLSELDISVRAHRFDFQKMRAEKITVVLSGYAALADWRAISDFINSQGLGECEVNIKIG